MKIVAKYACVVEQTSIDEAYLDMSRYRSYKKARVKRGKILKRNTEKERLTASVGIGPNKMVAKIASDIQKPDGLAVVLPARVVNFSRHYPCAKSMVLGQRRKRSSRAEFIRLRTYRQCLSKDWRFFSVKTAKNITTARAVRHDELSAEHERKSIGEQETFHNNVSDMKELLRHLEGVASRVFARFLKSEFKSFRTVVLTVRFADFETVTRSYTARALSKKMS